MIVCVIKNKENKYLNVNEWWDIDFYDEIYLASLFENRLNAEMFLKENFDRLVKYGADPLCVKEDYDDCKIVAVEIKEIEPVCQHEDKGEEE